MKKYLFFCIAFAGMISSCAIEITDVELTYIDSIAITYKVNDVIVGQEHQLGCTYSPWDAEAPGVFTWHSSDTSIVTVDDNGLLSAIEEGEATITLNLVVPRKKDTIELSDTVNITVHPIEIEYLQLNRNYLTMLNGTVSTLTATIIPANAKPKEIEWLSSNPLVATVVNGVVTARSAGVTTITAQIKDNTNIYAQCEVTVNPIVLSGIRFETTAYNLEVGFTASTRLIFTPDNAEDKRVTYTSSNPAIATVNQNGVITAVSNGKVKLDEGPGRATITATSAIGGHRATCTVDVYSVPDLVTVTVEILNKVSSSLGLSGTVIPTLHNNSSKPIYIKRFRLLDRFDTYHTSIIIESELAANSDYRVNEEVVFMGYDTPRAEFTVDIEGKEYKRYVIIRP